MTGPIRLVAFDLMDTVVRDPYREALEAGTGLSIGELRRRRGPGFDAWPAFERGELTEEAYWRLHEDAGIPIDREAFHDARRSGYRFVPGMAELVDDLQGRVRRVIASNYPHWIAELATGMLAGRFETVIASSDIGVRKPDPAFFERLLAELEVAAADVLFVDDREVNVEAARDVGLRAHRFDGVEGLRRRLRDEGVELT